MIFRAVAKPPELLSLARRTLLWHLDGEDLTNPALFPRQSPPQACFVSLKLEPGDRLRGCIGSLAPTKHTLEEEVVGNAVAAASQDPRFDPVRREELARIRISIDLLTPPEFVESEAELDPFRYGLIVRAGDRCGVLLPDLPGVQSVARQIAICREKAGLSANEIIRMERFTVERLDEMEPAVL